jgi:hypothetical protein
MPLVDATLSTALQNIDAQMLQAAKDGNPWTAKQYRDAEAAAMDMQTKTATVITPLGVAVQVVPATGIGATTAPGTGTVS